MPRGKSTTKSTNDIATTTSNGVVVDSMVENEKAEDLFNKATEPLCDSDEIEVVSLIPNITYKDSKTGDIYEWEEAGHVEYMTFEMLKNMWRNNKGYFRNMCLKPNDDRVINKFGLTSTFDKYEYLMNASNYTKNNIQDVCDSISNLPNGLKFTLCNKIKDLVISGDISDAYVIKKLEKYFGIDLISFL